MFTEHLVIVRGGGDIGTGAVLRLHRSGFPVVVAELEYPLTVRRTVAVSSAVHDGEITVEGLYARRVETWEYAIELAARGTVPVIVSERLPDVARSVVVDARLAKHNIDTRKSDGPLVIALGPGFTAGVDCHAVVETARGARLGRVLYDGSAEPNTGVPGEIVARVNREMSVILNDPEVVEIGTHLLRVLSVSGLLIAVALTYTGGLQGTGDTKSPLYIAIVSNVIVPLGICFVMRSIGTLQPIHIWIAILVGHATRCTLSMVRFKQGRWRNIEVGLSH